MHPDYKLVSIKKRLLDRAVDCYAKKHGTVRATNAGTVREALEEYMEREGEDDAE